jgi:FtsP/CotA-like multicopper oxidase with cupredoxin domain
VSDLTYVFGYASLVALNEPAAILGRLRGYRRRWGVAMNNWEGGDAVKHFVDRETGAENAQIDWTFRVGDQVKLRLVNEMDSDHPMPHPFHVHGAGRFLILARDDVVEPNLVWKDTVLVRTGETVDILLDVTNPGRWMAHCHIAEHHESGMMFTFDVLPA